MNSVQRSLLEAAKGYGLKPNNQTEADQLEVLRRQGYLRREDPNRLSAENLTTLPIYRLTLLGQAAIAQPR